jgi:hypothetical protein
MIETRGFRNPKIWSQDQTNGSGIKSRTRQHWGGPMLGKYKLLNIPANIESLY